MSRAHVTEVGSRRRVVCVLSAALWLACGRTALKDELPVAEVVPRAEVLVVGDRIILNGSSSYDPEGEPLSFAWRIRTRPAGSFAGLDTTVPGFARLRPDREGLWEVELVVEAGTRTSQPASSALFVQARAGDGGFDAGATVDAGLVVDGGAGRDAGVDAGRPFDAGADLLDADEIYIAGTLSEGACYAGALAHWSTPNVASVGFECYFDPWSAVIRPSDGRMLYLNTGEGLIREYHCDECQYVGAYPMVPSANDAVVPATCPLPPFLVDDFRIAPDGRVLHSCRDGLPTWRDSTGAAAYDGAAGLPRAVGSGGWLLTDGSVVQTQTAIVVPVTGLPPASTILTARWSAAGDFLVAVDPAGPGDPQLWRVSTRGTATLAGVYPPVPVGYVLVAPARLDPVGRLYMQGTDGSGSFFDVIFGREVGGSSDVIYTEASRPLVKLHISGLVTGP